MFFQLQVAKEETSCFINEQVKRETVFLVMTRLDPIFLV